MIKLSDKEKELLRLLSQLPHRDDEIPNEHENAVICHMLTAINDNAVGEYIEYIKKSGFKSFEEFEKDLLSDMEVEIVDDDELNEDERV